MIHRPRPWPCVGPLEGDGTYMKSERAPRPADTERKGSQGDSVVWGREPQRALAIGVSIEDGKLRRLIIPTR